MNGVSFEFDGVDFGALGYLLRRGPEVWAAGADFEAYKIQNSDITVATPASYRARRFDLSCAVVGDSVSDLIDKLDQGAAALSAREPAVLQLDKTPGRYWLAQASGEVITERTGAMAEVRIPMVALDPFAFSTDESTVSFSAPAEESVNAYSGGSVRAWPVVTFQAVSVLVSDVIIEQSDVDRRMSWSGSIAAGQYVRFDCQEWRVFTSSNGVDWALDMTEVAGDFLYLAPGNNNVRLVSPGSGVVSVTWRDRYI